MNDDYLLKVPEVAKRLSTSKNKVYDLINAGLLSCLQLGSQKVRNHEINRFLQKYDGIDLDILIKERKEEKETI